VKSRCSSCVGNSYAFETIDCPDRGLHETFGEPSRENRIMLAAVALTLTLQVAPAADAAATSTRIPTSVMAEAPAKPERRSWAWTAAGAYGFSSFGAGVGALVANQYRTRDSGTINLAMGIGALAGLLPGVLFGNEAREEQNHKARAYIPVMDVVGTMTGVLGYVIAHSQP
jgi:hypothetical protein